MMNPQMPRRPRQHQLEAESRTAIRSAIPSRWVYRDLDQDYGIDSEVEIFDHSGLATGLKFLVQLKATDEPELRKALRLWFPLSKAQYYASLDLPVLIARYHAPSEQLFIRWFHSFDPYYGKRTRAGLTFRLGEEEAWNDATPDRLVRDVEAYRELNSPRLREPLTFSLSIAGDAIHGVPAYQLRLRLRELARQCSHLVAFDRDEASPHSVRISDERIEVKVGGAHGFTLHTPHGYAGTDADSSLHYDIMLGIGLALDRHGHPVEAADIIAPSVANARLPYKLETAVALARCLARANQMHQALEISERFFGDDSTVNAAQVFLIPLLAGQRGLSTCERDFAVRVLGRIAADVERRGDNVRASVLRYNTASLLRGMKRYREAIRDYRTAARLDERYLDRAYFWRELAGVLFLSRRYVLAASLYERSLALEDNRLTSFLHADALMFSGRYGEAEAIFERNLESPVQPDDAEWALKSFALSWLREQTGIDQQHRRRPIPLDAFQPANLEEVEIEEICRRALEFDALSALAWFNLAGVHRTGSAETAARCFLLAALIVPWDLEAWGNVVALAMQTRDSDLFGHALCAAYQINGEEFLGHIADRVPENRDEFVDMLAQAVDQLPSRSERFTLLRTHYGAAGWDEVVISHRGLQHSGGRHSTRW